MKQCHQQQLIDRDGRIGDSLFFTRILNAIAAPVAYIDQDCCYRYVNQFYADWFSLKAVEMEGQSVENFLGPAAFACIKPYIDEALSGRKAHYEQLIPFQGGSRYVEATYTPDIDEQGRVQGFVAVGQDVTARKHAEIQLREKQEELLDHFNKHEKLLKALPVAVYTCNREGAITFFNDVAVRLWGYRPEIGDKPTMFCACKKVWLEDGTYVPPDQTPMAIALQTGQVFRNVEAIVERPDGSRFDAVVNVDPLFDKAGNLCGAVNIFQDISHHKRAEQDLRESESRYRNLVQDLPVAVYTTDEQGYITLFNGHAVTLWGREALLGKDRWCASARVLRPDGVTAIPFQDCPIGICLREQRKVNGIEVIIERADGTRKHILPHVQPLFDSAGRMSGAVNMMVDITERKAAEEYRAKLAAIIQFSEDAIIGKTTQGIITSWNPAAEKLYGYSEHEMIGQPMTRLIPVQHSDEEPEILERIKKGERVQAFETKRVARNGRPVYVSLTVSPIRDMSGQVIGASHIARDISRLKEDRAKIVENEERLRMASEIASIGNWEYQPASRRFIWSDECKKIYGIELSFDPDASFIEEHLYAGGREDIRHALVAALDPAVGGDFQLEYRIIRENDRKIRWVKVHGKVYFDERGKPNRVIGTMLDITEEKRQAEELIESVELFRTMADNVPAMIWMSGNDKFNDYFNRTWLDFTGRHVEQEQNEGWLEGVHPDDVPMCVDTYNEALAKQEGFYCEYRLRRHDGQYRWIADNSTTRHAPDGTFLGFISACIDIDDQKRFREKIQDSELLFKTISNTSPAALWMTDQHRQTVFVNDTWLKWTAHCETSQLDQGWLSSLVQEDRAKLLAQFLDCFERRESFTAEFRMSAADGSIRWCMTEGKPYFDINGLFAGFAGSVTDITEIKKLEQRKDDFIKMASHELKTPITSINGYVQLLMNIYNEAEGERLQAIKGTVRSSLGTIAKQVSKLSRLVTELLDLSKIDTGRLELHCAEFNLQDLVEEVVQDIRHIATRHAIIVDGNFVGKMYGDKDRLGQVLMNILNNAIKYSPDAPQVEMQVEGNDRFVTIRIKDYGIGIDPKDHKRIFERFYRVEGKKEQTYPGFGIGLFIADEIVRRHHGSVDVRSEKEKGAVFTINLPLDFRK